ncbi:hypothetical protein JOY44_03680 [Phormidium sp. CLA17]|uniref:hypothetical protein n=1 Tax=Leptolyngbya sp. Cla-17 TaxID=2803751 RepID=UPI001491A264|nr:hypothetical protein [Leptolyngbya sp. Cla-17]MBM0740725.1 hypothetical protein [Leptolyngbya sp. Cla-17]
MQQTPTLIFGDKNIKPSFLSLADKIQRAADYMPLAPSDFLPMKSGTHQTRSIAFPAPVRYKLKAQTLALYYSARTSSDRKPL